MNAVTMLIQDHGEIAALFERFENVGRDKERALAAEICRLLTVHAQIEEELFYPAARQALRQLGERLLDDAAVEHASLHELVRHVQRAGKAYALFSATVRVMGEYFRHHLREEETLLFPRVENTDLDLDALGERMHQRKLALLSAANLRLAREEEDDEDELEEDEDLEDEELEEEDEEDEDDEDFDDDEDEEELEDDEDEEVDELEGQEPARRPASRRPANGRSRRR